MKILIVLVVASIALVSGQSQCQKNYAGWTRVDACVTPDGLQTQDQVNAAQSAATNGCINKCMQANNNLPQNVPRYNKATCDLCVKGCFCVYEPAPVITATNTVQTVTHYVTQYTIISGGNGASTITNIITSLQTIPAVTPTSTPTITVTVPATPTTTVINPSYIVTVYTTTISNTPTTITQTLTRPVTVLDPSLYITTITSTIRNTPTTITQTWTRPINFLDPNLYFMYYITTINNQPTTITQTLTRPVTSTAPITITSTSRSTFTGLVIPTAVTTNTATSTDSGCDFGLFRPKSWLSGIGCFLG